MVIIYSLVIRFYAFLIKIVAPFNSKAKLWINGRKNIFKNIEKQLKTNEKRIWIHTSSLGEFEQGRPVIESIKKIHPEIKIVLTFFSPSGYEIRKNYELADYIFYLPIDTKKNAKIFTKLINPQFVLFVKYDFWYHYINQLSKLNIPIFVFSAVFNKKQIFFKWYGSLFKKLLQKFTHIFVQNSNSEQLIKKIGINTVSISGDTRFDRVYQIAQHAKTIELIEKFTKNYFTIIIGSSWPADEKIICQYINEKTHPIKYIIAPHLIDEAHIEEIEKRITKPSIRYSDIKNDNHLNKEILIINNIGLLSSLYQYGDLAYIGGGFGKAIHNIQEPTTHGLPVIFGPNYHTFKEAIDLINLKAAHSITTYTDIETLFDKYYNDKEYTKKNGLICKNYIKENIGATDKIMKEITKYL